MRVPLKTAARTIGITPYRARKLVERRLVDAERIGPIVLVDPDAMRKAAIVDGHFGLTVAEVGRRLRISWDQAMGMIRRGDLRAREIRNRWFVDADSLPTEHQ